MKSVGPGDVKLEQDGKKKTDRRRIITRKLEV